MHRKYWVRVGAASRGQLDDVMLQGLKNDMPELQHRQMPCAGIATSE